MRYEKQSNKPRLLFMMLKYPIIMGVIPCLIIICIFYVDVQGRTIEWNPRNDFMIIQKCNRSQPIQLNELNEFLISKKWSGLSGLRFKCFLNCLYVNYDWMNENGEFILENMQAILTENDLLNPFFAEIVLEKCTNLHYSNSCENAFEFTQCFWLETKYINQKEFSMKKYDE